jgi:hypothetical protein
MVNSEVKIKLRFKMAFARTLLKRLKRNPTSLNPMVNFEVGKKRRGQLEWKMVF